MAVTCHIVPAVYVMMYSPPPAGCIAGLAAQKLAVLPADGSLTHVTLSIESEGAVTFTELLSLS